MTAATTTANPALVLARGILNGTVPMPRGQGPRLAAVIARQALEATVQARYTALAGPGPLPTMRAQLVVLRELDDRELADAARAAWDALSRACHHHAYELSPTTATEVGAAVGLVERVVSRQ